MIRRPCLIIFVVFVDLVTVGLHEVISLFSLTWVRRGSGGVVS